MNTIYFKSVQEGKLTLLINLIINPYQSETGLTNYRLLISDSNLARCKVNHQCQLQEGNLFRRATESRCGVFAPFFEDVTD
jgi:hypothetical protein